MMILMISMMLMRYFLVKKHIQKITLGISTNNAMTKTAMKDPSRNFGWTFLRKRARFADRKPNQHMPMCLCCSCCLQL